MFRDGEGIGGNRRDGGTEEGEMGCKYKIGRRKKVDNLDKKVLNNIHFSENLHYSGQFTMKNTPSYFGGPGLVYV